MNPNPDKPEQNELSPAEQTDAEKEREDLSEHDGQADGDSAQEEHAVVTDGTFAYGIKKFGRAAWSYIKHARVELIVAAALLILDLVTKAIVAHTMYVGQSISVLPDFLYISYVHNKKAAFGKAFGLEKVLGDNGIRIVFLIVTVLAVGVFCWLLYRCRRRHILMRVSLALIIAGALGNFFDRLVLHYVRDFVEIVFFGLDLPLLGESFAIFNIADVGLTVGVILFLVYFLFIYHEPKSKPENAETATDEDSNAQASEDGDAPIDESGDAERAGDIAQDAQADRKEDALQAERSPNAEANDRDGDGNDDA